MLELADCQFNFVYLYGIKPNTLAMKLSGYKKNNTQFIYA